MDDDFPATANTPGQAESLLAYKEMAAQAARGELPWWNDFVALKMMYPQFKNWRIWAFVAWDSQSMAAKQKQNIVTYEDFAVKVLGLKTARTISKWREMWGDTLEEAKAWAQAAPLLQHRRDIFDALAKVASRHDHKAHPDRKLALEMMGDYVPNQKFDIDLDLPKLPDVLDDLLGQAYGDDATNGDIGAGSDAGDTSQTE